MLRICSKNAILLLVSTLLVAVITNGSAFANREGVLPRGKSQGPGVQYKIRKSPDIDPSCYSYHHNPEDGFFYFSPSGDQLYWIAREKDLPDSHLSQSYLVELQLSDMRIRKVIGLKAADDVELVGHGNPLAGISLFDFTKSTHGCGQGTSAGVGIKWGSKNQIMQSFAESYYKFVPSDQGTLVADRMSQLLRGFDVSSSQSLPPRALPKEGVPLYVDQLNSHVYTYLPQGFGILQRHDLANGKVLAQLKLTEGMKLLNQGRRFAVVTSSTKDDLRLEIRRIDGWSGTGYEAMELPLASPFQASRSRVILDMTSGLATVVGESPVLRREWRHAMVVDARNQKPLGQLKAPDGTYVAGALLDPKSRFFIFVTRFLEDESLATISLFRIKTRKWEQLHLNFGN